MMGKVLVGTAAIVALLLFVGRKPAASSSSTPKPSTPKPPGGSSPGASTPSTNVPPGGTTPATPSAKPNNSPTLSWAEKLELSKDSRDQLYASAMVSNHKIFVVEAANKLATLGDPRAADLTQRIANWSSTVAAGNMTADEQAMVNNPLDFTLDQIIAQASQSNNANFVRWAASYARDNGRTESADALDQQYQSMTGA